MAESLASLFASGAETYVLQRMSELEKKMDVVNADYLQLSWRLAETLDENAKLSARITELERKVDVVDTEYVQVSSDRWLSVKDTKTLRLGQCLRDILRPNMLCKLINLEKLYIDIIKEADLEIYANKNVNHIHITWRYLPNFENFPSCRILSIEINQELKVSVVISTLSAQKHNIKTISVSANGYGQFIRDLKNLENYCKISGIAWERHQ
jgi:tetrahydromethanopterin S-methyltransferase subunit G